MASAVARVESEGRIPVALAFARQLEESLRRDIGPSSLKSLLDIEIEKIVLISNAAPASKRADLDKQGTTLWNLASKLKNRNSNDEELLCRSTAFSNPPLAQLIGAARAFACLLLDVAQRPAKDFISNDVRVMRCILRSSKHCLDQYQLSLAELIIERAAFYEQRLLDSSKDRGISSALSMEYLTLRVALAWRRDQLDLAKAMLAKLESAADDIAPSLAEKLSDLLFEIGKGQMKQSLWLEAKYWLEKSYDVLSSEKNVDTLSNDARELNVSVIQCLVRVLINLKEDGCREKAWNLILQLEIDCGNRFLVLLLKLELHATESNPSSQDYCDILQRVTRTIHLTDTNIKTVIHHIYKLRSWSPSLAHSVLVSFLSERLFDAARPAWREKALITVIWIGITSTDIPDFIGSLERILNQLAAKSSTALSLSATHAAQSLLWKSIESTYNQGSFDAAEAWCHISLHKLFKNSGSLNTQKLQRKLMLCALGASNPMKARTIYSQMPTINQKDPSSQYILYKVALMCQDSELAAECLDSISKATTKDASILYACVLEAQRMGDHAQSLASLQWALDKYDYNAPLGVHFPALLRCTARLLLRDIDHSETNDGDIVDRICKLFEKAAMQAVADRRYTNESQFSLAELDWFSRNSYNLALKVCTVWMPQQISRLVQSCLKLICLYSSNLDQGILLDLSLRRLFCEFLHCSVLIVLARSEEVPEAQLQHYLCVRKAVDDFRRHLPAQLDRLEGGAKEDLQQKYLNLLTFDFEAAARLKAWPDLQAVVQECDRQKNASIFAILADIVLASEAPTDIVITTLQSIINTTWKCDGNDIEKLSRWIRCLFSLALTFKIEIAKQLLDQVVSVVESTKMEQKQYPGEELEWLATTAFNRAIDFYCSSQDIECRRWAEKALTLSALCLDGAQLHASLLQRYEGLA